MAEFRQITGLSSKDAERKQIIDAARLTLSYVYFELADYDAALEQLARVTPAYHDYPEVLLTKGWCFITLQNYQQALDALSELCDGYPEFYNVEEAYFLRAQCYLKLGYYNFAVSEYNRVIVAKEDSANRVVTMADGLDIDEQEMRREALSKRLTELEADLIKTIPLSGVGRSAELVDDPELLENKRKEMVQSIVKAREEYNRVRAAIEKLRKREDKEETRKKWEAYAEFGKVRAMYLRETVSK